MGRRFVALFVSLLLGLPLLSQTVLADWGKDDWITNVIGPERLASGDEFGCHGYEGIDTTEENWVISECRDYLMGLTNASRWGESPISFGVEGSVIDQKTAESLSNSGFIIVGDMISNSPDGLAVMYRNGASLEKGVADIELLEQAEEDSLVSIHWRARVGDLRVREDKDAISWLEDQPVWFTTWGEWHLHMLSGESTSVTIEGNRIYSSSMQSSIWDVPGTSRIEFEGSIVSVSDSSGLEYPKISESDRKLTIGWRETDDGVLITQPPGSIVTIDLSNEIGSIDSTALHTFNDHHHSVTVVGHHTTNLFRWTQDFSNSDLVFTWLIERPAEEEIGWVIPALAISILIAAPASIYYLIRNDQNTKTNQLVS
ncbi:MAG: hypothetical protein CMB67_02410 [Euryarchaeota archaeon]|mgnify:CR=1 FL=1|nr:hypothetical protein [Euryarchaeota archaeon]|tara:strand:- start:118 stop:1230 length:1113 start_codon:yes stop_codon:yes gene_type:complete